MLNFRQYSELRHPVLNEVSSKQFEKIVDRLNVKPSDMSLSNMFGDKMRLAIPYSSPEAEELERELEKNGYQPNIKTGMATKQVQTQQGVKQQDYKIGKVIENLVKQNKIDAKWKQFWNKGGSGYSIIVSRSPVDLLRMSDFRNIQSCHSEGGSYFHCAIQEAQTGGAVAYLVKTQDLQSVNLQDKEIFRDPDRDIEGIKPISRLRIRLFYNDKMQLGLPEKRVYGQEVPGFKESINAWAHSALEGTLQGDRPRMQDFMKGGGYYSDDNASALFNSFFKDKSDKGDTGVDPEQENAHNNELRQEIRDIDQADNKMENPVSVHYNEGDEPDENGQIQFHWDAYVNFRFPLRYINKQAFKNIKSWELLRKFQGEGSYEEIDFDEDAGKFLVSCRVKNDHFGHPDEYRNFLQRIKKEYDEKYNEHWLDMQHFLTSEGIIKSEEPKNRLFQVIDSQKLTHFYYDEFDKGDLNLKSEPINIISRHVLTTIVKPAQDTNPHTSSADQDAISAFTRNDKPGWASSTKNFFPGMMDFQKYDLVKKTAMEKVKQWWSRLKQSHDQQAYFPNMSKFKLPFRDKMKKITEPELSLNWSGYGQDSQLQAVISFPLSWQTEQVLPLLRGIRFFDQHFDRLVNEIRTAVVHILEQENKKFISKKGNV